MALTLVAASAPAQVITTVAGGGPNSGPATQRPIGWPLQIALDASGNRYIATGPLHMVVKVDTAGTLSVVAGHGGDDALGDGGPALLAGLRHPNGVAVDPAGNVYISDYFDNKVRRVDTGGTITTIAGTGVGGFNGDGLATSSWLNGPGHLAFFSGAPSFLYIADTSNHRVRRINMSTGMLSTVAGTGAGGFNGDGLAASAQLNSPNGVAVHSSGEVYIADTSNHRVRRITGGNITTIAGTGVPGYNSEGAPATSKQLNSPEGVFVDPAGNVYIADEYNFRIRKVSAGTISTVAGMGSGFGGDGGLATNFGCLMQRPWTVAVDATGNILVGDTFNSRLRRVDTLGIINTIGGNGSISFGGDGGPAVGASLGQVWDVALDSAGNLFIADESNYRIRKVSAGTNLTSTVAGTGTYGYNGDSIPGPTANLAQPQGVGVDASGNVYIADTFNHRVRKVDTLGNITTVAGTGTAGYDGEGSAASRQLNTPRGVAVDSAGNVYIADTYNHRIRRVDTLGFITTVAGTGASGYDGEGPATSRRLNFPHRVTVDGAGILFISDTQNHRIRKVSGGMISTVAGNGSLGSSGDGGLATAARLNSPQGVSVDARGNFVIADALNNRVRLVEFRTGLITTIAGITGPGYGGDGGPATAARFNGTYGVAMNAAGRVFVADHLNGRIRAMTVGTDLEVTKTDGQTTDVPGTTVAYTIRVTNNGPNVVASVNLVDTPPATLTIQSYGPLIPPASVYTPGTGEWTNLNLATGQFAEMTVNATFSSSATGNVVNRATVAPPLGLTDPVAGNDQRDDTTSMSPQADVSIQKTDSPDPAGVGSPLFYTLRVFNNGPSDATNVTVTDTLPPTVTFASATPPCNHSLGVVTCALGTIAAGSRYPPLTITVTPMQPATISNTATVAHGEPDPNSTNDSSTAVTDVTSAGQPDTARYLTVTSKDRQNVVQWLNPPLFGSMTFGSVRIRFDTGASSCVFPTDPDVVDASTFDVPGTGDQPGRFEHNGLTNDTYYCYTVWVNHGGPWSAGENIKGRPFAVSAGPGAKWGFSTGIWSMVPPGNGVGVVYAVTNFGTLHAMVKGSGAQAGTWPGPLASLPTWKPASMNGPSQGRPSGIPVPTNGSTRTIFLSSQDGHVYAFNAETGAPAWNPLTLPQLAPAPELQAHPSGVFTMFGGTRDLIFVGTRDPAGGSKFYALRLLDGDKVAPGWEFDGGTFGKIGAINGQAAVDQVARRVYFGSREFDAVSNKTVWCLDLETGIPCVGFDPQAYGNVDTGVSLSGGRLFVGTNNIGGTDPRVRAIRTSDGSEDWPYPIVPSTEGAPKGYITVDRLTGNVYFSTATKVWRLNAGGGLDWSCSSLTAPSLPLFAPGDAFVYVGGGDGKLHRLRVSLGTEDTTAPFPLRLGDGAAGVGSPTYDLPAGFMYAGSEDGIVYAIQLP